MLTPGPHIIAMIQEMGYTVNVVLNPDESTTLVATDPVTLEVFAAKVDGDGYEAAVELARMVGIDLGE